MPDCLEDLHRDRISNRQFLFSKTQHAAQAEDLKKRPVVSLKQMKKAFPKLLAESAFIKTASDRLKGVNAFCALVIRMDDIRYVIHPEEVMIDLAGALDGLCRPVSGIWGIVDRTLLGCFLPGKNQKEGLKLTKRLKRHLAESRTETISVGIAVYPMISYEKHQILENAKKALDHAEFFGPGSCVAFDSVSLNISGDKYYQRGDIDGAIAEFKLALALDNENINVHNSMGVCYGIKGELDKALDEFKTAIRLDPKETMAVYNAGYVYFLKKDYPTALNYFLRAEKIDSNVFELAIQTGRVYLEMNQPETARKYLENATRLNPKSAPAFRILGDCYTRLDQQPDAVTVYKTALKLNPEDAAALSALGYLYEMQGKNADIALMFCRQSIDIDPEDGLMRHRLGRLYLNRSRFEEALAEFQKAHELGYDSAGYITTTQKRLKGKEPAALP